MFNIGIFSSLEGPAAYAAGSFVSVHAKGHRKAAVYRKVHFILSGKMQQRKSRHFPALFDLQAFRKLHEYEEVIMKIQITLTGQTLTAKAPELAEQSLGKLFCTLEADSEWDGLSIRLIFHLKNQGEPVEREVQVTDFSSIPVPDACIRSGRLYITAVGVEGDSVRLTTGCMPFGIPISPVLALSASAAERLSPSEYEQLLGLLGPLSQLRTGRKDHLVGAINWLNDMMGTGTGPAAEGYIDKSPDFEGQQEYTDELEYLRSLGDGKWTIDSSSYSTDCWRYFVDIWTAGSKEYRRERKYSNGAAFSEALYQGPDRCCEVCQESGGDAGIHLSSSGKKVITEQDLPLPGLGDAGTIPVASEAGVYSLTAVDNAEETAV